MLNYEKRKWMIKKHKEGMSVSDICRAQKVSRQTFYVIKKAFDQDGL
ncbi:MAG: helix-turn-helix domain-containing protein [Nanoarchaeota archaeon]|nr:helix-turn-helix domain-containing protein [Nanoarchaeota archaeon]